MLYESLIDLLDDIVYVASPDRSRFLSVSKKLGELVGVDHVSFLADPTKFLSYVHPADLSVYLNSTGTISESGCIHFRLVTEHAIYRVTDRYRLILDSTGKPALVSGTIRIQSSDSTHERQAGDKATVVKLANFRQKSKRDDLTRLVPLNEFALRYQAVAEETNGCIFWIGFSSLRKINDLHGLRGGDHVLTEVANRILNTVSSSVYFSRISSSEFCLVVPGFCDQRNAMSLGVAFFSMLIASIKYGDDDIKVVPSIGICHFDTLSAVPESFEKSGLAYREAKLSNEEKIVFFSEEINAKRERALYVERTLRESLTEQMIVPYFQRKVFPTGETSGFEALARLFDNGGNMIPPLEFVGLAERIGLINNLGKAMLLQAPVALAGANLYLPVDTRLSLAINVSVKQLYDNSLISVIRETVERHPQFDIELEITESVLIDATHKTIGLFNAFRQVGAKIILDDFGTGYSSLSYISRLPVDGIKIDRSFISDIGTDPAKHKLVRAIIDLAHGQGMRVVVEGIETVEQQQMVVDMGCDELQGFLFGRPVPVSELA